MGQNEPLFYLSDQTGEHKDAREKVSHLKGNLKDGMGFIKTPDVDQTADGVVVTTQVPVERAGVGVHRAARAATCAPGRLLPRLSQSTLQSLASYLYR